MHYFWVVRGINSHLFSFSYFFAHFETRNLSQPICEHISILQIFLFPLGYLTWSFYFILLLSCQFHDFYFSAYNPNLYFFFFLPQLALFIGFLVFFLFYGFRHFVLFLKVLHCFDLPYSSLFLLVLFIFFFELILNFQECLEKDQVVVILKMIILLEKM